MLPTTQQFLCEVLQFRRFSQGPAPQADGSLPAGSECRPAGRARRRPLPVDPAGAGLELAFPCLSVSVRVSVVAKFLARS